MLAASLLLNIAILLPVCSGLLSNADWTMAAYGPASPARSILLAMYMAIAVVSALLLIVGEPGLAAALLMVQVVYKLMTPLTVGMVLHPVVLTNLGVAAFHAVTLFVVWRSWP